MGNNRAEQDDKQIHLHTYIHNKYIYIFRCSHTHTHTPKDGMLRVCACSVQLDKRKKKKKFNNKLYQGRLRTYLSLSPPERGEGATNKLNPLITSACLPCKLF